MVHDQQLPSSDTQSSLTILSEEDQQSLESHQYGDLYIIGKLWVDLIKIGLLGTKWSLIPTVEAAKPLPPQRPPKMGYKDLPIYDSPHHRYQSYLEDQERASCPKARVQLMHEYLLPTVKHYRKSISKSYQDISTELRTVKKDIKDSIADSTNRFKKHMRCPDNLPMRQAVLAFGGLTGCYIGSGKTLTRKLFCTGCGLLTAGALCFPKETDKYFREFTFMTATVLIKFYNKYCSKSYQLPGQVPCKDELPGPPKKRVANRCPEKK